MRTYSLDTEIIQPRGLTSRTYKVADPKIEGFIDGMEALKQAIKKRLVTEQFEHLIYSFDYGINWKKLIGKDESYIRPEMKRMITDALLQDDRVKSISDFQYEFSGDICSCSFSVETDTGAINQVVEVSI